MNEYARRFPRGHWYGTYDQKPDGSWDRTAHKMLLNFAGSGHPVFRGTSDLERGESRSKRSGSTQSIELLLQMVISVNQLSLFGTVADMTNHQLVRELRRNPLHQVNWINKKFLHNLLSQKCMPMKSDTETCGKFTRNDLRNCQKTRSYPDYAPKQV